MKKVLVSLCLMFFSGQLMADSGKLEKIRNIVEGVYTMTEWTDGKVSLATETFTGRLTIQNGILIFVTNNYQSAKKVSMTGLGAFTLSQDKFAYGYHQFVTAITDDKGDKIDRSIPSWAADMHLPKMREFTLQLNGDTVTLSNPGGLFEMNADGFVYTDLNTKNVRVWKKTKTPTR